MVVQFCDVLRDPILIYTWLDETRKENTIRDPLRNIYGRFRHWLGIRKGRTESDESIGQVVEKESTVADKRNDRNYQDATYRGRKATKKLAKTRTTRRSDAGHGRLQDQQNTCNDQAACF